MKFSFTDNFLEDRRILELAIRLKVDEAHALGMVLTGMARTETDRLALGAFSREEVNAMTGHPKFWAAAMYVGLIERMCPGTFGWALRRSAA
jgi:hypothetical protein